MWALTAFTIPDAAFASAKVINHGPSVLWEGLPDPIERGPGEALMVLVTLPALVIVWIVVGVFIYKSGKNSVSSDSP